MQTAHTRRQQALLIHNVDWEQYKQMLRFFGGRAGYRLTYDRGTLEIMSPLFDHDNTAYILGRFVDVLTEELDMPVKAGRSTMFRRRKRQRGLDPDNCYWIANELQMRDKTEVDLRIDPPPDLAVEIDVTSSSIDRMSIYASLQIPEVWRLESGLLTFNVLQTNRRYATSTHSLAFPKVTPSDLLGFLALRAQQDETSIVKQFRDWVRQHVVASASGGGNAGPLPQ